MAAHTSKGTGSRLKQKNAEMAARMKAEGTVRKTCRCPICHKEVGIASLFQHLGKAGCFSK